MFKSNYRRLVILSQKDRVGESETRNPVHLLRTDIKVMQALITVITYNFQANRQLQAVQKT